MPSASRPHTGSPPARSAEPHALGAEDLLARAGSSSRGLSPAEAARRLAEHGPNLLPRQKPPGLAVIFLRQFLSPLIYVLLTAAVLSLILREWADGLFILAVLLLNAVIGTVQEHSAQRSAEALRRLVPTRSRVVRDGEELDIDAHDLVPGDVLLLESGDKIPADVRLVEDLGLQVDESLLTGESFPVTKDSRVVLKPDVPVADRSNMGFTGTLVNRGRGRGVVVGTGLETEVGRLAETLSRRESEGTPPLLIRMRRFTSAVGLAVAAAALLIFVVELLRGSPAYEVFLFSVALAVAAIPEGLPVALTIALAIGMRRMARRHVVIRRLAAVEALGSCTYIASDKTGTLTVNELTARRVALPGEPAWEVTGEGVVPEGGLRTPRGEPDAGEWERLRRLARACALCNEAVLAQRDGEWASHGDAVDISLLVLARKLGVKRQEALAEWPVAAEVPFEPERQFMATLHRSGDARLVVAKGAAERVLAFCSKSAGPAGETHLDHARLEHQARELAEAGYRVLAVAETSSPSLHEKEFEEGRLHGMTFLGFVGMIDPLRPEAAGAVAACRRAGLEVGMVTGDHPVTALAIARELGLAERMAQVVTGPQLREAEPQGPGAVDALTRPARVFARMEPAQKLQLIRSLARRGHFVAATGDGANDAPALRAAHVGVAMGRRGTDVARESASLILTDDHFASIAAGVEEGRVAYSNVRKVIFLLISTNAAEILLVLLALGTGLPLPLLATQLLWLNLVTEGIQDVALACEPGEGDEMSRPPRRPQEPIFNRLMTERVLLSAAIMGAAALGLYRHLLGLGRPIAEARNSVLLLMVFFENVHVFNSRSELRSALRHNPLRNPLLFFGVLGSWAAHAAAMHVPALRRALDTQPVTLRHAAHLLGLALVLLLASELHKAWRRRKNAPV